MANFLILGKYKAVLKFNFGIKSYNYCQLTGFGKTKYTEFRKLQENEHLHTFRVFPISSNRKAMAEYYFQIN